MLDIMIRLNIKQKPVQIDFYKIFEDILFTLNILVRFVGCVHVMPVPKFARIEASVQCSVNIFLEFAVNI